MNLDKHLNVRYQSISKKRRHNNFEKSVERLEGEFMTDFVEIISKKRVITDEVPGKPSIEKLSTEKLSMGKLSMEECPCPKSILVHYNFFILANSKLHILKSMNFFIRNLDTTGFRINYMDTDSIVMSVSKPIDDLVLPHRKGVWQRTKPKWFVMNSKCPHEKREPGKFIVFNTMCLCYFKGLLKEEFKIQNGVAVFLSPKLRSINF